MTFDTLTLSRAQFALTAMFHYLFPPLSIGLGMFLVFFKGLAIWRKDSDYQALAKFWTRIFAVNFTVGVATGVVLEFEFGTNWGRFATFSGDVFGSALAAEGIFAFFLESGFLAVLVFGWDRVSDRTHFIAAIMVAFGACFSAIWIVVANSWMNTPTGYRLVERRSGTRAEIADFWGMIFNPSSTQRIIHVILAAWVLGAFFVLSVSAWHLLKKQHEKATRKAFRAALAFGALSLAAIFISGDSQARNVAKTQPAKLAGYEGNFRSKPGGTPMTLIAWPNVRRKRLDFAVRVPGLLSFLVYGDWNKPVAALDRFPERDRPPVAIPFAAYHLMVYSFGAMALLVGLALTQCRGGRIFANRPLLRAFVFAVFFPYLGNEAGWVATEVGRQPWVVKGLMRTEHAYSLALPAGHVLASLGFFALVFALLLIVWLRLMNRLIQEGPEDSAPVDQPRAETASDPLNILAVAAHRTGGEGDSRDLTDDEPKPPVRPRPGSENR